MHLENSRPSLTSLLLAKDAPPAAVWFVCEGERLPNYNRAGTTKEAERIDCDGCEYLMYENIGTAPLLYEITIAKHIYRAFYLLLLLYFCYILRSITLFCIQKSTGNKRAISNKTTKTNDKCGNNVVT